jgi:hypothetical protein
MKNIIPLLIQIDLSEIDHYVFHFVVNLFTPTFFHLKFMDNDVCIRVIKGLPDCICLLGLL